MRSIHQIWIGEKQRPTEWMDSWKDQNPDMPYNLWTDFENFYYEDKIRQFHDIGRYAIAADIMRVEILYHLGGVYIDADSVCLKPIQDAPFINDSFFAAKDYTEWVANGVIGCDPFHPIMAEYFKRIATKEDYWEFGARMLTPCIEGHQATILPTCTFYPKGWRGQIAPIEGEIYAQQMWATTRGKYATTDLHS